MDALRIWGIAVSGSLMAVALLLWLGPNAPADAQPHAQTRLQVAQAPARAEPIVLLVRFTGSGPIARAQRMAARGQIAEAQRQLQTELRRQDAFRGLCLDHFTVGAAEVVLRTCAAIVPSERQHQQQRWLAQLRAMRAVSYVDVNATAAPSRSG